MNPFRGQKQSSFTSRQQIKEVGDISYDITGLVTHWMPLPEPPDKRYKCRYADDNGVCSKCSKNGEIIYYVEGPCPYMFEEVLDDGKSKLD